MARTYRKKQNSNNNRRSNNNDNGGSGKKKTGSKTGVFDNGARWTNGWNVSKANGLVKLFAKQWSGSTESVSKSGRKWSTVIIEMTKKWGKKEVVFGLMDVQTGQTIIKDMQVVLNPKAPNGGYCGQY